MNIVTEQFFRLVVGLRWFWKKKMLKNYIVTEIIITKIEEITLNTLLWLQFIKRKRIYIKTVSVNWKAWSEKSTLLVELNWFDR